MLAPYKSFSLSLLPPYRREEARLLSYEVCETSYGRLLVATNELGLCFSTFVEANVSDQLATLSRDFPRARLSCGITSPWLSDLWRLTRGETIAKPIPLVLYGTPLQCATWRVLLDLPRGSHISYTELAVKAGFPRAVRAVATAVGRNRVVPFVPCHRVVLRSGDLGQYSALGGSERKRQLLMLEGGWCQSVL